MICPYTPSYDEHTCISRSLKAYLDRLEWAQGKHVKAVVSEWSEPIKDAYYPTIVIQPFEGEYQSTAPHIEDQSTSRDITNTWYLIRDAEYVAYVTLEVHANDAVSRSYVIRALKDKFMNTYALGTYGVNIPAIDYLNADQTIACEVVSSRHVDSSESVSTKDRIGYLKLRCRIPSYHIESHEPLLPVYIIDSSRDEIVAEEVVEEELVVHVVEVE